MTTDDLVVTGMGVICPNGLSVKEYWSATLAGESAIAPISRFDASAYPTTLAGEIPDFRASEHVSSRVIAQTDRWTQTALAAADEALADAELDSADIDDFAGAVVTASSSGGTEFGQLEMTELWARGPEHVGAYQSIAWFYAATTGQLSIRHKFRGPCGVLAGEQAGGLDAIAHARRLLRSDVDVVLTGGTDASLCPYGLVAQLATGRLSPDPDPARAYRPFDSTASGYVPGEGGAILVVERAAVAQRRVGPRQYGVVAGYGASFDPPPHSSRPPTLVRAIVKALQDADLRPEDIDVIFADASGVPELDRIEAEAINEIFRRPVPVTAPKTMTGRLYAGGAPMDVVAALLSIRDQIIPPTVGVTDLAVGCGIELVVDSPRPARLRAALVLARGFGGFNSAMVVTGSPERR